MKVPANSCLYLIGFFLFQNEALRELDQRIGCDSTGAALGPYMSLVGGYDYFMCQVYSSPLLMII